MTVQERLQDLHVGNTILQQLGGNRFRVMTGASSFLAGKNSLQFNLPTRLTKYGINKCVITLEATDLYTISFYKVRGVNCTLMHQEEMVYFDQLQDRFTETTGLDTHL